MAKNKHRAGKTASAGRGGGRKGQVSRDKGADGVLERIADALERLAPPSPATPDFLAAEAFVWHPEGRRLAAVARINDVVTENGEHGASAICTMASAPR